ncbi:polyprenyl synthetase family protein [Parachlamydia sp. AcF125]|uniref:polyprenyl synthetase family protein n=1 Tax=Parachlamydia sp. AcF125 TaxID=2795736 RepID=UPI001BD8F350|nr:farnesyl diphosphate synthase [Parachlamydia sp. AcF125]MBS4168813.1 Farnesyl diphosphate synthase [Parachlamydia sp. AcF125]
MLQPISTCCLKHREKICVEEFQQEALQHIEDCLDKLLPETHTSYQQLFDAARYSLLGGGKRIRPLLTLAVTQALTGTFISAIQPACALELIHTYSLIHDDLPSMDNDDFRRGKPSLHKVFPEGHAILTGDFLLTYAFEVVCSSSHLTASQIVELVSLLAKSAGGHGMIAGQIMDISAVNQTLTLANLQKIHQTKTGALITCAIEFGAILSNCSLTERHLLQQFGNEVGLAFQILDDILDITSSHAKHGGSVASDLKNNKTTYATLLGVEKAQLLASEHVKSALAKLEKLPLKTNLLHKLVQKICPTICS